MRIIRLEDYFNKLNKIDLPFDWWLVSDRIQLRKDKPARKIYILSHRTAKGVKTRYVEPDDILCVHDDKVGVFSKDLELIFNSIR